MSNETRAPRATLFLRLEWIACLLATALAVWLHAVNLQNAGALWRDEAGGLGVATLPTLGELWTRLNLDSFPLAMPLILRTAAALGADSDSSLRALGAGIGLGVLAALWWAGWKLNRRPPLLPLALLAVNTAVIRWGDSLRAYGLGTVGILLALGCVWGLLERPTWPRFVCVTLAAMLSVHALFPNAFLFLGICCAAWVICWRRRNRRAALRLLLAGAIAAATLLPYLPGMLRSQEWWALQKTGFAPAYVWHNIEMALGSPNSWQFFIWLGLLAAALVAGVYAWIKDPGPAADARVFGGVAIVAGAGWFTVFIWLSGLPTQQWYFVPPMAIVAVCISAALNTTANGWRVGALALLVAGTAAPAPTALREHLTNVDRVAARLARAAAEEDLIIVHPWYCGTSFRRYYNGAARWTTIPPLADLSIQRFDLFRAQMLSEKPARGVIEDCERVLAAGHRVWLVGHQGWFDVPWLSPDDLPPPQGGGGWSELPYEIAWAGQVAYYVGTRSTETIPGGAESEIRVSGYENLEYTSYRRAPTNGQGEKR